MAVLGSRLTSMSCWQLSRGASGSTAFTDVVAATIGCCTHKMIPLPGWNTVAIFTALLSILVHQHLDSTVLTFVECVRDGTLVSANDLKWTNQMPRDTHNPVEPTPTTQRGTNHACYACRSSLTAEETKPIF